MLNTYDNFTRNSIFRPKAFNREKHPLQYQLHSLDHAHKYPDTNNICILINNKCAVIPMQQTQGLFLACITQSAMHAKHTNF